MRTIQEKSKCNGCHACSAVCPKNCINMLVDEEGFWYPQVDKTQCMQCGLCEKICPIQSKENVGVEDSALAYAARHKDETIRLESSSGGVFTALATKVLGENGVVFGAAFDEKFNVVHKYIEKTEELEQFRGSKYVQSKMGDAYVQAEAFLKQGKTVLFTGTPCQIEGLLSFLRKPYDNLITQDIICHGVPSPMVWKKYVEYRQAKANGAKPRKIAFRAKNEGWKRYSVSFIFDNDTEYRKTLDKDPMMQVFLKDLCLRPSCYDCAFKQKNRRSDITLADFWGIQNVLPEMDDDKGTSLVFAHTPKGQGILQEISDKVEIISINGDEAIKYNPAMIKPVKKPLNRETFFDTIRERDFVAVQKKFLKVPLLNRLRKILSKFKNKLFRRK